MPRRTEDPKWSDPGLLVLSSLAGGPKHGLAILNDLGSLPGARIGPGTLYGVIARLEARGLIVRLAAVDARRHPYELTAKGVAVLREQVETMEQFVANSVVRLQRFRPDQNWVPA